MRHSKLLPLLLTLAMLLAMLPAAAAPALADDPEPVVAEVADTYELRNAAASFDYDVVRLTDDIEYESGDTLIVQADITLDLNGHTLEPADGFGLRFETSNGVIIQNGGLAADIINAFGDLTFDGVEAEIDELKYPAGGTSELTVTGGSSIAVCEEFNWPTGMVTVEHASWLITAEYARVTLTPNLSIADVSVFDVVAPDTTDVPWSSAVNIDSSGPALLKDNLDPCTPDYATVTANTDTGSFIRCAINTKGDAVANDYEILFRQQSLPVTLVLEPDYAYRFEVTPPDYEIDELPGLSYFTALENDAYPEPEDSDIIGWTTNPQYNPEQPSEDDIVLAVGAAYAYGEYLCDTLYAVWGEAADTPEEIRVWFGAGNGIFTEAQDGWDYEDDDPDDVWAWKDVPVPVEESGDYTLPAPEEIGYAPATEGAEFLYWSCTDEDGEELGQFEPGETVTFDTLIENGYWWEEDEFDVDFEAVWAGEGPFVYLYPYGGVWTSDAYEGDPCIIDYDPEAEFPTAEDIECYDDAHVKLVLYGWYDFTEFVQAYLDGQRQQPQALRADAADDEPDPNDPLFPLEVMTWYMDEYDLDDVDMIPAESFHDYEADSYYFAIWSDGDYMVTLFPNGGTWEDDGSTGERAVYADAGDALPTGHEITHSGDVFLGWVDITDIVASRDAGEEPEDAPGPGEDGFAEYYADELADRDYLTELPELEDDAEEIAYIDLLAMWDEGEPDDEFTVTLMFPMCEWDEDEFEALGVVVSEEGGQGVMPFTPGGDLPMQMCRNPIYNLGWIDITGMENEFFEDPDAVISAAIADGGVVTALPEETDCDLTYFVCFPVVYDIVLDPNGGEWTEYFVRLNPDEIDEDGIVRWPIGDHAGDPVPGAEAVEKEGFELVGWVDEDGNYVTEFPEDLDEDLKLTAKWKTEGTVLLTFLPGEGSGDPYDVEADAEATVVLPAPTDENLGFTAPAGKVFDKWEAKLVNGNETDTYAAGDDYIVSDDVTFTALWKQAPYEGGAFASTYKITVAESAHGTVTPSVTTASAGATVKITVTPDAGFVLSELTGKASNGAAVVLTKNTDGSYSMTMPAADVELTAKYVTSESTCDKGDGCPLKQFSDLDPDAWYHDGIHYVLEKGYMNGFEDGTFRPALETNRAQIVTVLWRMAGSPVVDYEMTFLDVAEGQWYTEAVRWAESVGVAKGFDRETFAPELTVTREQMCAFLYRYAQLQGKGFTGLWAFELDFSDAGAIEPYAQEAMTWCVMNGIINGVDGQLQPQGFATRAQVAAVIERFCQFVK